MSLFYGKNKTIRDWQKYSNMQDLQVFRLPLKCTTVHHGAPQYTCSRTSLQDGTEFSCPAGQRDSSLFIVPEQRDNWTMGQKILHCPGTKGQAQNLAKGQDGPGQPVNAETGRGTGHDFDILSSTVPRAKRDRAEKDILEEKKVVLKQKRTF